MNIRLTYAALLKFFKIFANFLTNFNEKVLKFYYSFKDKKEMLNCLNQHFWLRFCLKSGQFNNIFSFFMKNGTKYDSLVH